MIIACTSTFYNDLIQLSKKIKDLYSNCLQDILLEFEGKSTAEIALMGDQLNREIIPPNSSFKKIRIKNSLRNEGSSGGFRLMLLCLIVDDTIILLHVYPKTGRLLGEDPKQKGRIKLIEEMIAENGDYYILDKDDKIFKKSDHIDPIIE